MSPEYTRLIHEVAPKLYHMEPHPDYAHLSKSQQDHYFGPPYLGVADGWFTILFNLSKELEAMEGIEDVHVTQVKEKFGGLRFYISSGTSEMFDAIDYAEEESYTICETCGEPGEPRNDGWIQTLCDKHMRER